MEANKMKRTISASVYDVNGSYVGVAEIHKTSTNKGKTASGKTVYKLHGHWRLNAPQGRVVKGSGYQIGSSDRKIDKKDSAMRPGKRRSATGNIYFENRKNRSDLHNRV